MFENKYFVRRLYSAKMHGKKNAGFIPAFKNLIFDFALC